MFQAEEAEYSKTKWKLYYSRYSNIHRGPERDESKDRLRWIKKSALKNYIQWGAMAIFKKRFGTIIYFKSLF